MSFRSQCSNGIQTWWLVLQDAGQPSLTQLLLDIRLSFVVLVMEIEIKAVSV